MNILVLGNGFDLAHGLPTKYGDFLDFLKIVNDMAEHRAGKIDFIDKLSKKYPSVNQSVKDMFTNSRAGEYTRIFDYLSNDRNVRDLSTNFLQKKDEYSQTGFKNGSFFFKIPELTKNNFWYNYFINKYDQKTLRGENWVDFEAEISKVVKLLENAKDKDSLILDKLDDELVKKHILHNDNNSGTLPLKKPIDFLLKDLCIITYCLEQYLLYVKKIKIDDVFIDITALNPEKIINFNYIDTYSGIYKKHVDTHFIHGSCHEHNEHENSPLVLGIEEYLEGNEKNTNIDFLEFKKHFQRIYKKSGVNYKTYLNPSLVGSEFFKDADAEGKEPINTVYFLDTHWAFLMEMQ